MQSEYEHFEARSGGMNLDEMRRQRNELDRQIEAEECRLRAVRYRQTAEAMGITIDAVELSSGGDKPWFGTTTPFAEWLKANSKKRFCEWNGCVYLAADFPRGIRNPLCDIDTLKAAVAK